MMRSAMRSTHDTATLLAAEGISLQIADVAGQKVHVETGAPFRDTRSAISISRTSVHGTDQVAVIATGSLLIGRGSDQLTAAVSSTKGNVRLRAGGDLLLAPSAFVHASNDLTLKADDELLVAGLIDHTVPISSKTLIEESVKLRAGRNMALSGGQVTLSGSALLSAQGNLSIEAARQGGVVIKPEAGRADDDARWWSSIDAGRDLSILAYEGQILAEGMRATGANVDIVSRTGSSVHAAMPQHPRAVPLYPSVIRSGGDLVLASTQGDVAIQASTLVAKDQLQVAAGGAIQASAVWDDYVRRSAFAQLRKPIGPVAARIEASDVRLQAGTSLSLRGVGLLARDGHFGMTADTGAVSLLGLGGLRTSLDAAGNMAIHARRDIRIDELTATSGGSLGVTSAEGSIQSSNGYFSAGDLLSFSSLGSQRHASGAYNGGALSIHNQTGALVLDGSTLRTGAARGAQAQPVSGQLSIESGGAIKADAATSLQAKTDLSIVAGSGSITITPQGVHGTASGLNLAQNQLSAGRDLAIAARKGVLTLKGQAGTGGNSTARVVSFQVPGRLLLGGSGVRIEAAKLRSGGDMDITAYNGNVVIDGVKNDVGQYVPQNRKAVLEQMVNEVRARIDQINNEPGYRVARQELNAASIERNRLLMPCGNFEEFDACQRLNELNGHVIPSTDHKIAPYKARVAAEQTKIDELNSYIDILNRTSYGSENLGAEISGDNVQVRALGEQPGMAHLQGLAARKDVNWQPVGLAYDRWSYKREGLTPAGAALVAVAVAVVSNGAGSSLLGTSSTIGSAMADTAFASLASQASITLVNNGGDVGKTLEALGKSDTAKAAVAAALTAGALDKIGALDSIKHLQGSEALSDKLTLNLINAGGRSLTNTAINGGSLEEALKDALIGGLVDTVHGEVASQIKVLESEYLAHKLAHALAGCTPAGLCSPFWNGQQGKSSSSIHPMQRAPRISPRALIPPPAAPGSRTARDGWHSRR